ncbi:MAG: ABC transporter ATP-binding protein [Geminicoccaceae bacterium]|jgi:ABC-type sugar transport system ATPase subunit|nr:ABC transporter ATP-binding protein [Geminicoccaceae bacterium]HRY24588.1 ABC transporter ATP-binding protein [Geminicoccaceae bacterium]
MAGIRLDHLKKSFGAFTAVQDLDLDVTDGEFLVLLGPSGCGKTTTLNCIAGLETPSAGRILFDGRDVTSDPPHSRNIAMVFQSALLYPHMTAAANIEASLRRSDLAPEERRRRIDDAVSMLEIGDLLDKLPSEMSGGQRQRVATAKAIVRQPTAFLLDEPLSALDAALRMTLRAEIVNLQKRLGSTTVFVTHDQVEAMTMGDRIAVMNGGRLEQIGTPSEIYERPRSLFVAGFVGSPPMNLIRGEVADGVFAAGELRVPLAAAPGPVTLGVRPQHLHVRAEGGLPCAIFALERLGRETVLIVEDRARNRLRLLVEAEFEGRVGDPLDVAPDPARCLLFDDASGLIHAPAN